MGSRNSVMTLNMHIQVKTTTCSESLSKGSGRLGIGCLSDIVLSVRSVPLLTRNVPVIAIVLKFLLAPVRKPVQLLSSGSG